MVIGAGAVGTRKARTLLEGGARVSVISIEISEPVRRLADTDSRLTVIQRPYAGEEDIRDADLVIAATNSVEVNARVAKDALALHRLVSVVNAPYEGSFTSMATHRARNLTIGVSAGRAPRDAMRVRDAIAERLGELSGESR